MGNDTRLKILMVATETAPFAKEGGVGDVMGSLPKALAALGHEVRVVLPRYGSVNLEQWGIHATGVVRSLPMAGYEQTVSIYQTQLPDAPVTVYFVDNGWYFGQHQRLYLGLDQRDEQRRFLLFCRGILEALPALQFVPDIIHLNDWQTAPCAAYLRTTYAHLLRRGATRIVYTIHNLQYQGRWDPSILDEAGLERGRVFTANGLELWGDVNWMKAGIIYADVITTVSQRYAQEIQTLEYGWGLDEMLFQRHSRVMGIPNGIDWDSWNPATDTAIAARYSVHEASQAKASNRVALRAEFDLPDTAAQPVVGIVSRLVDQKGFDLLADCVAELGKLPMQFVVLGTGHPQYEQLFRDLSANTANVRARIGFDNALAHRIYAGADFFLMPSAFEPGGLGQLIAMRYGALPIVHATGGLADTVSDIGTHPESGNGVSFEEYSASALLDALNRSICLYENPAMWTSAIERAMAYDSRWSASAQRYSGLYANMLRLPSG